MAFNSIFDFDHYPTPANVVERMLQGVHVSGKTILEPSAGAGNIVDVLRNYGVEDIIACEINPDLRGILSKKCDVIEDDFLKLTSECISHIDLIVMNPPFSRQEDHLRHAYDIAPGGCEIVSLCNSTMFTNTYSSRRADISELIELYGYKEELGSCFATAERYTNVNVGLVRLFKPKTGDQEFDGFLSYDEDDQDRDTDGVIPYDYIRDLVNRYMEAVKRFDSVMEASNEINELSSLIGGCSIRFGAYSSSADRHGQVNTHISRERFRKTLQIECWKHIFNHMDMDKHLTRSVMNSLNKIIEKQVNIPFSIKNVYLMLDAILQTKGDRMRQTLVDAFDKICSFSDENSTAGEKWKTNSDYKINRKFIVPWIVDTCRIMKYETVHVQYDTSDEIMDIVKALCFISGVDFKTIPSLYEFSSNINVRLSTDKNRLPGVRMQYGEWYEWGFFRIKGFKKGTMHFEFLSQELVDRFNYEVAKAKGWQLPKERKQNQKQPKASDRQIALFE